MGDEKLRWKHTINDDFNYLRARKLFMEPEVTEIDQDHLKVNEMNSEGLTDFLLERDFNENRVSKWIQ